MAHKTSVLRKFNFNFIRIIFSTILILLFSLSSLYAVGSAGEELYKKLSAYANEGNNDILNSLNTVPRVSDWSNAETINFKGHLRFITSVKEGTPDESQIFFIRSTDGDIYILNIPDRNLPDYQNLEELIESKLIFELQMLKEEIEGEELMFVRFVSTPVQPAFDKIFKLMIVLMLFLVMVGMGLTLTPKDFSILIKKPKGFFIGEILQFGIMPLVAVGLGYIMGFQENFPYIFVGMVLITATPGGVTSNLMTHYAKGDVALSVALTSVSTVLSIIFVPLLLTGYCANIPEVRVPAKTIALTIIVLVLVPLAIGMLIRGWKEKTAKKMIPIFNILGIIALLFLIVAGIINNIEGFADTERHGFMFYTMVLTLTFLGMIIGAAVPALFKVNNYQIRAVSLETGLRNASLAMTIALLIQDSMGDFHSSMFWVSGIFGLTMYIAGVVAIKVYPKLFPVKEKE
jgi:predicted Na+-dependent transporter